MSGVGAYLWCTLTRHKWGGWRRGGGVLARVEVRFCNRCGDTEHRAIGGIS